MSKNKDRKAPKALKLNKKLSKAANPAAAALIGALGGAAMMLLSGERVRAAAERLRERVQGSAQPSVHAAE